MGEPCDYCGEPSTGYCRHCRRPCCPSHLEGGSCVVCTMAICRLCNMRPALSKCIVCGALACPDCLVQIDNVRRACKRCAGAGLTPTRRPMVLERISRVSSMAKEWIEELYRREETS
ncbi:MAG: hypothetical protein LRS43_00040 [Desulfurococcales archaeon]|nr:hypothetical protein [Desulfurococcales archaeon]